MDFLEIAEGAQNIIYNIFGAALYVSLVLLAVYAVWMVVVAVLCFGMSLKKVLVLTTSNPILRMYDIQDKYFNYPHHECSIIPPRDTWELCRGLWKLPRVIPVAIFLGVYTGVTEGWDSVKEVASRKLKKEILYKTDDN